ncbi:hypothetical protein V7201_14650 [Bacillus sp. JJ1122]|uniref:hypothetical protein n=1 Tax=Bacillus sp. JJ1122 TaxID=3122951 RepID=UPI002FFDD7B9
MKKVLSLIFILFLISGCNDVNWPGDAFNGNPSAQDILTDNPDADIFVMDGYVFSNAENVEWVKQQEYELGEQVGEIIKQTSDSWRFKESTASKLPVGTKIYETDAPFYIAIVDGEENAYIKLVEG